jgi:hypothetical protein
MFINSSTNKEDWASVRTIEELSEADGNYPGQEDQCGHSESKTNLAMTYVAQGLWKQAEELFMQVMEARQNALGAKYPDTLTSMANLASMYRNQGRWKKAENLQINFQNTSTFILRIPPIYLTAMFTANFFSSSLVSTSLTVKWTFLPSPVPSGFLAQSCPLSSLFI